MGQVYRAWHVDLQRRNAMKFILGIEPDVAARERFMVEARATARIQHPNVVTIYEVGEFDGRPYLVMEYLSGKTLDKVGGEGIAQSVTTLNFTRDVRENGASSRPAPAHGALRREHKEPSAAAHDEQYDPEDQARLASRAGQQRKPVPSRER
jgi:hypothetical protein